MIYLHFSISIIECFICHKLMPHSAGCYYTRVSTLVTLLHEYWFEKKLQSSYSSCWPRSCSSSWSHTRKNVSNSKNCLWRGVAIQCEWSFSIDQLYYLMKSNDKDTRFIDPLWINRSRDEIFIDPRKKLESFFRSQNAIAWPTLVPMTSTSTMTSTRKVNQNHCDVVVWICVFQFYVWFVVVDAAVCFGDRFTVKKKNHNHERR